MGPLLPVPSDRSRGACTDVLRGSEGRVFSEAEMEYRCGRVGRQKVTLSGWVALWWDSLAAKVFCRTAGFPPVLAGYGRVARAKLRLSRNGMQARCFVRQGLTHIGNCIRGCPRVQSDVPIRQLAQPIAHTQRKQRARQTDMSIERQGHLLQRLSMPPMTPSPQARATSPEGSGIGSPRVIHTNLPSMSPLGRITPASSRVLPS